MFCQQNSDIESVLSSKQFAQLAEEVKLQVSHRKQLLSKLYSNKNNKQTKNVLKYEAALRQESGSPYIKQFQRWKQQSIKQGNSGQKKKQAPLMKQQSRNSGTRKVDMCIAEQQFKKSLMEMKKQKLFQQKQQLSYSLNQIKKQYNAKLKQVLLKHNIIRRQNQIKQIQIGTNQRQNKNNYRDIGIQTVSLQQMHNSRQKVKEIQQFQKNSFQNIIRNPPLTKNIDKDIQMYNSIVSSDSSSDSTAQITLDIDKILKLPYRNFLVFFQQNLQMITRLCSLQDMNRLIKYRDQSVNAAEFAQKLKKKLEFADQNTIRKLPKEKKQKLFKILYQN